MKKKVISVLLIVAMTLGLGSCAAVTQLLQTPDLTVTEKSLDQSVIDAASDYRDGTPFDEIEYERYDDTELLALIDEAEGKLDDAANADEVLDLFDRILAEQKKLWASYEIADLKGSIDATDEFYSEEVSALIDMDTDDADLIDGLGKAILDSPCGDAARASWDEEDIEYYDSYTEVTDEQRELISREQDLENQYEEASVQDFTVEVDGEECSYYDLVDLYYDGSLSRDEYRSYYRELTKAENDVLGPIYVEMVKVRNQLARSYGYDNYIEYAYTETYGRDYTPDEALELAQAVKDYLMEAYDEVYWTYDSDMGAVLDDEIANMPIADQMDLVEAYLPDVDSSLLTAFLYMKEYNLYDLEMTDTKLNTGFTTWLDVYEEPFLFNEPEGDFYDLMSLVHEFGHFNAFYQNWATADAQCIDLAEIHSQGLEALYTCFYPEMFGEEYGKNATDYTLIQLGGAVLDGCMYDEFQQRVYAMDDPTLEDINEIFCSVATDYEYDYGDNTEAYEWVEVPHNFSSPLYYISYAVSALPALQIWETAQTDQDAAIAQYLDIVSHGESGTFVETLTDCGMDDPFSEATIKALAQAFTEYAEQ